MSHKLFHKRSLKQRVHAEGFYLYEIQNRKTNLGCYKSGQGLVAREVVQGKELLRYT